MFNNLITWLIIYFLLGCSWLAKADLYNATLAYQNTNYQSAFDEFTRLAKLGNADAMYNLGVMYLYGQGVDKSQADAFAWFSLAKDFGISEASQTAQLVLQQSSTPNSLKTFLKSQKVRLNSTYRLGATPSLLNTAQDDTNITKTHNVLPEYPKEAMRQGVEGWVWLEFDVDASGKVTNIDIVDSYPKHIFTASLLNAVEKWRYSGAKNSHTLIYHFTTYKGEQYQATFAIQKKTYEAQLRQNIDAAEQGVAQVQYYIANWLSMKDFNAYQLLRSHWRSENPADDLYVAAAKNGLDLAQYRIANVLLNSHSHKLGTLWLEHAANSMDVAKYRLASILLQKEPHDTKLAQAIELLEQASSQGHLRSILKLVSTHLEISKDLIQARKWLDKGLNLDSTHPHLLLLAAKLAKSSPQAKEFALQSLQEAQQRRWNTHAITQFLKELNHKHN
ncbi:hypothetical protein PSECIP111951_01391 [Pseudoalteromonas holothuriae]|uniref:Protein TonB n=1 Tax=Pseudoalteromonas holothuriae TaxID=2963714 RepID=A0A9W4QQL2_9GAMM|nr:MULTISPECIES: TonB family protein [unclassified Pseudoalteromonas]CAH9049395.1 hypothetical protein PSECIP111854_00028 [Pseudoalteromonas sp. CIP111854]CAH9056093.1 hypothetical protein PSECIP111951_01391 [Pseudoalteromonas sp. CIP111951]